MGALRGDLATLGGDLVARGAHWLLGEAIWLLWEATWLLWRRIRLFWDAICLPWLGVHWLRGDLAALGGDQDALAGCPGAMRASAVSPARRSHGGWGGFGQSRWSNRLGTSSSKVPKLLLHLAGDSGARRGRMLGLAHEVLVDLVRTSSMLGRRFPYCPHSHLVPDDLENSKDKSFEKNHGEAGLDPVDHKKFVPEQDKVRGAKTSTCP